MLMVGLTGGIGSGKSAVAARLAEWGAVVIDSDVLAREVVAPGTDGLAEVVAAFGPAVLGADGGLDRAALGRLVFADPHRRRRLEEIVHPRVRARTAETVAAAPADAIVVNDVPLLVEAGLADRYDLVVVVLADEATRLTRLVGDRGMAPDDARARIAAQASDEQRRAVADVLIVNDGTRDELRAAVDDAWRTRIAPAARTADGPDAADGPAAADGPDAARDAGVRATPSGLAETQGGAADMPETSGGSGTSGGPGTSDGPGTSRAARDGR
jgi:dephospho-CoA kinase